jgi:hypothetical protein
MQQRKQNKFTVALGDKQHREIFLWKQDDQLVKAKI